MEILTGLATVILIIAAIQYAGMGLIWLFYTITGKKPKEDREDAIRRGGEILRRTKG
jgi:hypothetical protein